MTTSTYWHSLDMECKITEILREIPYSAPEHHLGRAFMTAYQLAIEFERRFPQEARVIGQPVGGAGTGQRTSLAQYISGMLSRKIKAGELPHIEGGFLANQHLKDISFTHGEETIHSSLTDSGFLLSMFRLRA